MKAVGFNTPREITDPRALGDIQLARPEPGPRDLLVAVEAVSVNPIDTKVRQRPLSGEQYKVAGYDAAGRVEAVGAEVRHFKPGDRVWYAGTINRQGSNAQFHCVDERIVAHKPDSLGMQEAAAMPLTTLTAWEGLEDQLGLTPANAKGKTLLVVGGAGGVGSMATQIAARHLGMTVIATAGRTESAQWCSAMGAAHTVDYRNGLLEPVRALGVKQVDAIFLAQAPDPYWQDASELIAPFGGILAIVDALAPLDLNLLKPKSVRFAWESMFTHSLSGRDLERQGDILTQAARLVDGGTLETTLSEGLGAINAANLREAHRRVESGKTIGKLVLAGWDK